MATVTAPPRSPTKNCLLTDKRSYSRGAANPISTFYTSATARSACSPAASTTAQPKRTAKTGRIRTSQGLRVDLFATKSKPAQHTCEFTVPAMDGLTCPTGGSDNVSDSADRNFAGAPQPDGDDPNIANISGVPALSGTSPEASSSKPASPRITQSHGIGPNTGTGKKQYGNPHCAAG